MDQNKLSETIESLKTGDLSAKIQAARDLGNAAGDEKINISDAKDTLIHCLINGEDEALRASSAMALYNATGSGIKLEENIQELKKSVNDNFFGVRYYSIPLMAELANSRVNIIEALPELTNQLAVENDSQIKTNLALTFFYMAEQGLNITEAIPVLITALAIPENSPIFYMNLTDSIISFVKHNPDQKDFVMLLIDSSPINKTDDNVKKILAAI